MKSSARITGSVLFVMAIVLAGSTMAIGGTISGTRDSTSFQNSVSSTGGYWSYECDVLPENADNFDKYEGKTGVYSVASSILTIDATRGSGEAVNSGYVFTFPGVNWPDPDSGTLTMEWRARVRTGESSSAGNAYGTLEVLDGSGTSKANSDYWQSPNIRTGNRTLDAGSVYCNGLWASPDVSEYHAYRLAITGYNAGGYREANFYIDTTLVAGTAVGSDWGSIVRSIRNWVFMDYVGDHVVMDVDYIRLDTTGAWAPVPEPVTLALLAVGGVLGLLRRRRSA